MNAKEFVIRKYRCAEAHPTRAMKHSYACYSFHQASALTRRHVLKVGGLGLLGLTMNTLWAAESKSTNQTSKAPTPRAKSIVFLYQFGGPSHIDMFDMKPDAPEGIRGPHKPMASNVPGIQVSEHLPRVAKIMDKVTLIRSMHHTMKNHNSASYYALSGHEPPVDDIRLKDTLNLFPAYGSIVSRLAPSQGDMPTFVSYPYVIRDGSVTPGQHASFLGKVHDPFLFTQDPNSPSFGLPELSLPVDLPVERLEQRRELQKMIDQQSRLLDYWSAVQRLDCDDLRALSRLDCTRM